MMDFEATRAFKDALDLRAFHNRLRILRNIDKDEFVSVDAIAVRSAEEQDRQWVAFRDHPYDWFIRASDDEATGLFQVIRKREER